LDDDDLDAVLAVLARGAGVVLAVVDRAVECAFAAGLDDDDLDAVLAVLA